MNQKYFRLIDFFDERSSHYECWVNYVGHCEYDNPWEPFKPKLKQPRANRNDWLSRRFYECDGDMFSHREYKKLRKLMGLRPIDLSKLVLAERYKKRER
ncbi:hypothetical protein [Methylomonas koyamae]|uniref:hypothetical protein n=1 Tax=Methylomonas koyamae TaxID=702114 RepID=UPI001C33B200|nr:hypothetical protein [Methylomonas koyamae]BBL56985.1 hypothetical protein MKFW12EY_05980 [Methylomonas koyamae]